MTHPASYQFLLNLSLLLALILSLFLIASPQRASGEQAEELPSHLQPEEAFGPLFHRSQNNAPLTDSEKKALLGYLNEVAQMPYPRDPLHGWNGAHDTSIKIALQLATRNDIQVRAPAEKMARRADLPPHLRQEAIGALPGEDAILSRVIREVGEGGVEMQLLAGHAAATMVAPGEPEIELLAELLTGPAQKLPAFRFSIDRKAEAQWNHEARLLLARKVFPHDREIAGRFLIAVHETDQAFLRSHVDFLREVHRRNLPDPDA